MLEQGSKLPNMQKRWDRVGVQPLQGWVVDPLTSPIPRKVLGISFHRDGKGVKMQLGYLVSFNQIFWCWSGLRAEAVSAILPIVLQKPVHKPCLICVFYCLLWQPRGSGYVKEGGRQSQGQEHLCDVAVVSPGSWQDDAAMPISCAAVGRASQIDRIGTTECAVNVSVHCIGIYLNT